jgi:hypothetical protein
MMFGVTAHQARVVLKAVPGRLEGLKGICFSRVASLEGSSVELQQNW